MKKTSPWFLLLFPIAVPAMIVLDYFGYRVIAVILLVLLVLSFFYYLYTIITKFSSLRGELVSLAQTLCDPGSWSVRHYPYHHTLSGSASGRRFHYSLLGHDEGSLCQLFLECPVQRPLNLEGGAEPQDLPAGLSPIVSLPGFRSLQTLTRRASILRRLASGLAGSGGPGIVLRMQGDHPFSPPGVNRALTLLQALAATLDAKSPPRGEEP